MNDEYISKKEILNYLNGYLHLLGYDNTDLFVNGQRHALINVLEDILTVKAADVQPVKHGEWLKASQNSWNNYKCSLCNTQYVGMGAITFTYCPNCGARMDMEREKNE